MERWENEQNNSEMMIYTTEDGLTKIETTFDGDTVWLSIDQMAELFQRDKSTISRHIKNIFAEGELNREAVVANFATTAADGKTYQVDHYNLDVIISVGYRVKSQRGVQFRISIQFFKKVQNKIHYAIHGQTAAEVIYTRADAEKEFMGLTTFSGSQPTLKEAVVAKNYLNEKELRAMGQLVSGYLDFAERQAEREQAMTMQDWSEHLDRILTMSGEQLLIGNGSVSHKQAVDKATGEYRKYKARTLSEVERDYLDSIKLLEQKTDKKQAEAEKM